MYARHGRVSDGKHNQALGFDMFRVQNGKIAEHLGC